MAGRDLAVGWGGSNAPDFVGEDPRSPRRTALQSEGHGKRIRFLELERVRESDGSALRRQLVQADSATWLVLDSVAGSQTQPAVRTWTFDPEVRARIGEGNRLEVASPDMDVVLRAAFLGSRPLAATYLRGSKDPFAGWVVMNGEPQPADSYRIVQAPGHGWILSAFWLEPRSESSPRGAPVMESYEGPDTWRIRLPSRPVEVVVERDRDEVRIHEDRIHAETIALRVPARPDEMRARVEESFRAGVARYPKWRELWPYRLRLALAALAVLVGQELFFAVLRRKRPAWVAPLRLLSAGAWLAGALWAGFVYFGDLPPVPGYS